MSHFAHIEWAAPTTEIQDIPMMGTLGDVVQAAGTSQQTITIPATLGSVTQVIVAEQDVIDSGMFGNPTDWVQTSYNTHAGEHPEGRPMRKNYAGIGFVYDQVRDAFYAPQPYPSWILNEATCVWDSPVPYPIDGVSAMTQAQYPAEGLKVYEWDEPTVMWREVPQAV